MSEEQAQGYLYRLDGRVGQAHADPYDAKLLETVATQILQFLPPTLVIYVFQILETKLYCNTSQHSRY